MVLGSTASVLIFGSNTLLCSDWLLKRCFLHWFEFSRGKNDGYRQVAAAFRVVGRRWRCGAFGPIVAPSDTESPNYCLSLDVSLIA